MRVTANQVTMARLVPMPLIAWLIYQGPGDWWWAIGLALVVGSTDYIDGALARKHGPTVLGALLDPLADKVFLAFMYVPLADLRFLPASAVALMFAREFLVTAMRSAYAQRNITFETSYLAKVKTWVQMQGSGTLMVCALLPTAWVISLLGAAVGVPLIGLVVLYALRRRLFRNLWVAALFGLLPLSLYLVSIREGDLGYLLWGATWALTALTWVSGLDYFVGGLARLRAVDGFNRADAVRVVGAALLPLVALAALVQTPAPAWAVLGLLASELAVGGLDNLLSVHHRAAPALPWGARSLGAIALLGATLLWPAQATPLSAAAFALSLAGSILAFYRGRDIYMAAA